MATNESSLQSIDEDARRRFEAAWRQGQPQPLERFLPPADDPRYRATLEELVQIEMEFAWKAEGAQGSRAETVTAFVEAYVARFPCLHEKEVVRRLLQQEYRVRRLYGHAADEANLQSRFPEFGSVEPPTVPTKPSSSETLPLPQVPGYEVLGELGRGGMGVVYKARQQGLNRLVALKTLRAGSSAHGSELARFRSEAEALARLRHPHIVQVYEVGEQDGQPFFALEFVEGGSLAERLADQPPTPREAAALTATLARAVHAAHQAEIIHRDLKPGNVLLTAGGTPKIADFGLAKQLDAADRRTQTGTVLGTPAYMAPEQAEGDTHRIGPATDVWALGAILYEMLTGRTPFKGTSAWAILDQIREAEPARPAQLRARLPRDLETICLKCLEKDPTRRYATGAELADDLDRFLADEPVRARPLSLAGRLVKWTRRRPAVALLWCALGLAGTALAGAAVAHLRARLVEERAEALTVEADELRGAAAARRRSQEQRSRAQDRYQQFLRHRDTALLHAMLLTTSPDRSTSLKAAQAALQQAFAAAGVPEGTAGSPALEDLPFNDAERAAIRAGCYKLLVVLANALVNDAAPGAEGRPSLEQALGMLDQAGGLGLETVAYHRAKADCLERLGDKTKAAQERTRAAGPPTTARDWFQAGSAKLQRGQPAEAIDDFVVALQPLDDRFWPRCCLILACLRADPPAEIRIHLDDCLRPQPERGFVYPIKGRFPAAEGELVATDPEGLDDDTRWLRHLNRGVLRLPQQQPNDAIQELRQAITLRPGQYEAHVALALAYEQQKELDRALAALDGALRLRPGDPALYRRQAQLHLQRGDRAAALRDLDSAIAREPASSQSAALMQDHLQRGELLYQARQFAATVRAFDAALALCPDNPAAHRLRALARAALADRTAEPAQQQKLREAARKDLDVWVRTGKPAVQDYRTRARLNVDLQDYPRARDDCTRVLDLQPDAATYATRGWLYLLRLKEPRSAQDDFEEAVKLDPKRGEAYAGRGAAKVEQSHFVEAISDAEQAVKLGPDDPQVLYHAARICAMVVSRTEGAVRQGTPLLSREKRDAYQARALELLERTLDRTAPDRQGPFWREVVQKEPAWYVFRSTQAFKLLAAKFGPPEQGPSPSR
jgi:tetratricopeptide (TPR) repeat protein